ncbi:MAG: membrane protein insertion efficiency factor YidD [Clostridia bacterium]|nr:membrane protein insertion efficiency factor YidD [Clostridia bacterium]
MKNLLGRFFIYLIRIYQVYVSPRHPGKCKYSPTCSNYAIEAIRVHGAIKGSLLSFWRILRCNPFSKGGYDPVPEKKQKTPSGE